MISNVTLHRRQRSATCLHYKNDSIWWPWCSMHKGYLLSMFSYTRSIIHVSVVFRTNSTASRTRAKRFSSDSTGLSQTKFSMWPTGRKQKGVKWWPKRWTNSTYPPFTECFMELFATAPSCWNHTAWCNENGKPSNKSIRNTWDPLGDTEECTVQVDNHKLKSTCCVT